jgi:hypothetical protein
MVNSGAWSAVTARRDLPVVIICHNLLADLSRLVQWLEGTGHETLLLLDNASTYPPLLDYLASSPHQVIRMSENLGHTAPWESGLAENLGASRPFAITDPDVLPDQECPADAAEHFQELLLRHPQFDKAGFGLHIDDIPAWYPHRDAIRQWEAPFWSKEIESGVFAAHIDTTFAVIRPGTPYKVTEALRTAAPYTARHLPWYRDPRQPDSETEFFFSRRRADVGYWNRTELPAEAQRRLRTAGRRTEHG